MTTMGGGAAAFSGVFIWICSCLFVCLVVCLDEQMHRERPASNSSFETKQQTLSIHKLSFIRKPIQREIVSPPQKSLETFLSHIFPVALLWAHVSFSKHVGSQPRKPRGVVGGESSPPIKLCILAQNRSARKPIQPPQMTLLHYMPCPPC